MTSGNLREEFAPCRGSATGVVAWAVTEPVEVSNVCGCIMNVKIVIFAFGVDDELYKRQVSL